MPFLLPAAATAVAAAAPAAAATTAAATAGATLTSIATNIAMNVAISAVMSALQPQVGAAGRTAEWTLSPDGPIPFAAGRIGVAGSVVHRATFGPDLMYLGVPAVLSGAGPIDGYESFKADDEWVNFDGNGKATSSQYAGELWYRRTMGYQPDVAVASPPGLKSNATLPGWGAQHKLSGKAAYMVVMGENSKGTAFPTGEIKPLITLRGLRGWDPRLDSTWPGGAGPCRLDNPATWVYLRRPGLWGLKWSLGLWEGPTLKGAPAHGSATDHQVGGIGAKLSGIDVAAFVNLENICDANDWTVSAYPTTDDDKFAVLESFLQAGGATFALRAGKISCIQRAAPRASIVTISAADTAGPLEIDTAASRIDRINTIRPRIMSEAHRWQMTAITEVSAQAYRDQDGGVRPRGIDYTYVDKATQGAQLAALQIANTREGIAGIIPLKPHLQKIKPGDAFTITEPGFVLNGLKCLCLSTEFDPSTKIVAVSFVSETDAKYAFALGQSQDPPEPAELEPVDPRYVSPPGETEWEIVARPPAEGGAQVPGFDLVGEVDNATATALLVEWGPTAEGPWTQAYMGPPTAERIPITGVQPKAVYYVSTMNIRGQNYSARRVFGPFTAPDLVSNDTVNVGDMPSGEVAAAAGQVPGLALTLSDAQLVLADHQTQLYTATTGLLDRTASMFASLNTPTTGVVARLGSLETIEQSHNAASVLRLNAIEATVNTPGTGLSAIVAGQTLAIADLQTGKASASQVQLLEAKVTTRPNLLYNGSGRQGLKGWGSGGAPWFIVGTWTWGEYFTKYLPGASGPTTIDAPSQPFSTPAGNQFTLSGRGYVSGLTNGAVHLRVYAYDNESFAGETYVGALTIPTLGSSPTYDMPPFTWTQPAGKPFCRVWPTQAGVTSATGLEIAFWRLKVENGATPTIYSEEADLKGLGSRIAVTENAVVDLATGKADASRVSLVEAQIQTKRNLIRNPSGADGLRFWENTQPSLITAGTDGNWGPWFQHRFDNQALHYTTLRTLPFQGGYGGQYTFSGEFYISGFANGYADLGVYSYTNAEGTTGETRCGGVDVRATFGSNYGQGKLTPITFTAPPGAVSFRIWAQVAAASPGGYSHFGFWKLKLEVGNAATLFSDDATGIATLARVSIVEAASADLEGRLEGRLMLNVMAGNQVAGGQLLAVSGPDASYSTIDWWSTSFRVSNGGTNPVAPFEVRGDVVRMRSALIDRLSVTTAITVGSFAFPVALEAKRQPCADGEVVSYGGPLGQIPELVFRTEGLDPLNAGESYLQYGESHTETGFIARRKIQTPATPASYNLTGSAVGPGGAGPSRIITRGANPVSVDNTYIVTGRGNITFRSFIPEVPSVQEGQSGTIYFEVQQRVAGVWSIVGYLTAYAQSEYDRGFGSGAVNEPTTGTGEATVTCSANVEAWGLRYTGQDGGNAGSMNDIVSVQYTAQGTGSGVRTATSGGQRPICEVRLKNA